MMHVCCNKRMYMCSDIHYIYAHISDTAHVYLHICVCVIRCAYSHMYVLYVYIYIYI